MKRRPIVLAAALVAVAVPAVAASSASAAVTQAWSKYFMAGGTAPVTGIKVSGYDGKSVYASVSTGAAGAVLRVGNTASTSPPYGYTAANTYSGASVQFIGTQDQVNAALASLTITLPSTTNSAVILKSTVFQNRSDLAYNPANQHFYKYVAIGKCAVDTDNGCTTAEQTARNPDTAKAAAEGSTELGLKGYLASITSAEENTFISSKIEGATSVIVGGRDADAEATWTWVGGPDNGTAFWRGCAANHSSAPGTALGYASWSTGEPNNYIGNTDKCGAGAQTGTGEDCMVTNWTDNSPTEQAGYWNDIPCGNSAYTARRVRGYVAEYGNKATGGDFSSVDIVDSTMNVAVPANKPTFLDTLFKTILGPKKSKVPVPKKPSKAQQAAAAKKAQKQTRLKYDLVFVNGGRFSFYLTNQSTNKLIPIAAGSSIAGRKLTKDYSVPVIRDIKANQTVKVVLDANTKKLAKGALLNVILQERQPDGSFKLYRQDAPDPPLVAVK